MNGLRHWLHGSSGQGGFTLAEIMVACAIISVGLVAVVAGMGFGVDGVEAGRQQSTALFLAEQRIEHAKELAMRQTGLVQLVAANLTGTGSEGYGSIAGAPPRYRRTTTITDINVAGPPSAVGKRVDVVVFYRPVTGRGVLTTERSVSLSIFLASR